jgi:hypothetical protein
LTSLAKTTGLTEQASQIRHFMLARRRNGNHGFSSPSDEYQSRTRTARAAPARVSHCALGRHDAPLLDSGVVYKVAEHHIERACAYRLVYDAYVQAGLMRPNVFQMRITPYSLLSTTAMFVALRGERVIATVSLVGDGQLGLPLERAYAEEVDRLRDQSVWLGEVSALACLPDESNPEFEVVIGLMRLMAQFSQRHGIDQLLVAVHPRHARFYRRAMGFQPLGPERPFPSVCNRPAVALHLDLSRLEQAPPENVALFFGEAIPDEQLRSPAISAAERRYFASAVAADADLTSVPPSAMLACA